MLDIIKSGNNIAAYYNEKLLGIASLASPRDHIIRGIMYSLGFAGANLSREFVESELDEALKKSNVIK